MALALPLKSKAKDKASTQSYLPVEEVREGAVVVKGGGLRAVLRVQGVNFDLKSEAEQNAIIASFQGFLNSLSFPIQMLIRSRKLDLDNYLDQLNKAQESQQNELLRMQTLEYIDFIKRLLEVANIMSKEFYVVVPYSPSVTQKGGIFTLFSKKAAQRGKEKAFSQNKTALEDRVESVITALEEMGLRAQELSTQELVEMFYNIYNPAVSTREKLVEVSKLTTPVVSVDTEVAPAKQENSNQQLTADK